jgi:beta-galactosidase/beta-glucuronidase
VVNFLSKTFCGFPLNWCGRTGFYKRDVHSCQELCGLVVPLPGVNSPVKSTHIALLHQKNANVLWITEINKKSLYSCLHPYLTSKIGDFTKNILRIFYFYHHSSVLGRFEHCMLSSIRWWTQVWYIWYVVRIFVNATIYTHSAQQLKKILSSGQARAPIGYKNTSHKRKNE